MFKNFQEQIPEEVRAISHSLSEANFENFLVGGCVRDLLLERIPKDWDITTIATPEEIQKLFPDSFYENEFGTVGVKTARAGIVEITPYRLESEYADSRHPEKVEWGKSVEEDLARRDFTVNAIALSLELADDKYKIIDPYEGKEDLKRKLIRTVGKPDDRFQEDALRILRALRISSELGFVIEAETLSSIEKNGDLLEKISQERIRDEFVKIIMSPSPAVALEMMARLGILRFISPELEKGIGVEQNQAHAYTVWEHLLRSLDHAAKKGFPLHVRLAALFHDIAKPHTKALKNSQVTFYGHEVLGARMTRKILENLRFPKEIVDQVWRLVRWHMFFSDTEAITLSAVRRMVRNVSPELIWDLMDMRVADRIGTGRPKETPYRLRKYHSMIEQVMRDPISVKQLVVDGADVMKLTGSQGGPHVGFILEILLSEVLDDPALNTREYLENRIKKLFALSEEELREMGLKARQENAGEEEKELEKIKEEYKVR
jgi:tRNA nucleotidyltransferase (CCA-adding enzyme)